MISVSCLKVIDSYSYVRLSSIIVHCCDFSFINYALCQAFPVSWAVLPLSAVAGFFVVFIKSFGVKRVGVFFRMILLCLSKKDFMLSVQL